MQEKCVCCGTPITEESPYRDSFGECYCATCVAKTQKGQCDMCGKVITGKSRSYFRSDGTYFCEKCFKAESEKRKTQLAAPTPQPEADTAAKENAPVAPAPAPARDEEPAKEAAAPEPEKPQVKTESAQPAQPAPPPPQQNNDATGKMTFRPATLITDHSEKEGNASIYLGSAILGLIALMFTSNILAGLAAAAVPCIVHWYFMFATRR